MEPLPLPSPFLRLAQDKKERELSKQTLILNPSSLIQIEEFRSGASLRSVDVCLSCMRSIFISVPFPSGGDRGRFLFLPQGGGQEGAFRGRLGEGIFFENF